jgi:flagellar biosynthesis protein FlhF
MRGMMQQQLAEISWSNTQKKEPLKAQLMRDMLSAGFSAGLSRYLIDNMPKSQDQQHGHAWLKAILANNLNAMANDNDMLEAGGVFALVGPTGVGKTTTTAKLAARCVMRHGANKLALITTDGYRIGGYEQLRIYGKILGVMVHAVKDEADLRIALSELKNKHTVLIDTVGMSQRDKQVAEQVAMLSGANVNKLLCLNATSNGDTLTEVIRSYQGAGLSGCIITKMDEAAHIGSVLDAVIRHKLTLYYLANGQRVPEDLHLANRQYLVDHAFRYRPAHSAWQVQDEDLPLLMGAIPKAMPIGQQSEVSLG